MSLQLGGDPCTLACEVRGLLAILVLGFIRVHYTKALSCVRFQKRYINFFAPTPSENIFISIIGAYNMFNASQQQEHITLNATYFNWIFSSNKVYDESSHSRIPLLPYMQCHINENPKSEL